MPDITLQFLTEQLELGELLLVGRNQMFEPQDLPGRYGKVVAAVDRVLKAMDCPSVVGGGWAVWRHGYFGRMTQDIDIALEAKRIDEFLSVAQVSGFVLLGQPAGRWPKLSHKDTGVEVDILPEGERPGTESNPAPTTIPHPAQMGAGEPRLCYMTLPALVELKIAAGRGRDDSDVIELVRCNADQVNTIRSHLAKVHADYVTTFDQFVQRAQSQRDQ